LRGEGSRGDEEGEEEKEEERMYYYFAHASGNYKDKPNSTQLCQIRANEDYLSSPDDFMFVFVAQPC
jgi:hypothetical protein